MDVSVEALKGLKRELKVTIPVGKIEAEIKVRLNKLAATATVHGFRRGKVPLNIIAKRYSAGVRQEVLREMLQSTLYETLDNNKLSPVSAPEITLDQIDPAKDFSYIAEFEVLPEIEIKELNQAETEVANARVEDSDVVAMLDKLREQNKNWSEVARVAAINDKILIDFEGFIDGVSFKGGSAQDCELILGSGAMIPGFEEGLLGASVNNNIDISVTFPKDYAKNELAAKDALFKVHIKKIMEGSLPELDDEFAAKFDIKIGGVQALSDEIRKNMERELEHRVAMLNREKSFNALLAHNKFELPVALVEKEIAHLKHEMYHRIFGQEHSDHEKIPDFPRELFIEHAERRIHLNLLFSEYVKKHEIKVDSVRVDRMINKLADAYERPEELRQFYQKNNERLAEIQALVIEEMVYEKIMQDACIVHIQMNYEDIMNPKKDNSDISTHKTEGLE